MDHEIRPGEAREWLTRSRGPGSNRERGDDVIAKMRLLPTCLIFFVTAFHCFLTINHAFADLGALARYRGDWMIDENRKHLVATRWEEDSHSVQLRYSYQVSVCPRWTRKTWTMRYDAATKSYTAIIQQGKATESAIGNWDEATSTMTWIIESRRNAGASQAKPTGVRQIRHVFEDGDVSWADTYIRADGTEVMGRSMTLNALVPYEVPEPRDAR